MIHKPVGCKKSWSEPYPSLNFNHIVAVRLRYGDDLIARPALVYLAPYMLAVIGR